jgi:hypothetical protein
MKTSITTTNDDDDDENEGRREEFADCKSSGKPGFWGGPLAENATQGVAYDVMMDAVVRLEAAGYPMILTIHDEIICETADDFGSPEEFKRIVEQRPAWAPDMPVSGKVRVGSRLAKIDLAVEECATGDWSRVPVYEPKAPKVRTARKAASAISSTSAPTTKPKAPGKRPQEAIDTVEPQSGIEAAADPITGPPAATAW